MSVEEVIADRLQENIGVTALVGTRVYQLKLPANPTLPAIRVQLISDPLEYHARGEVNLTRSRVQIDCYGKEVGVSDPYRAVSSVSEAVNAALSGAAFVLGGRRVRAIYRSLRQVLYEGEELRLLRITQDFDVFSETA